MVKSDRTLVFASWVVVEPAEEIPGVWVAHCLDFDVISQGNNPKLAIEAVNEAVAMTVVNDLCEGLDPEDRRAPDEYWEQLAHVLKNGKLVKLDEVKEMKGVRVILATQMTYVVERERKGAPHRVDPFVVPQSTAHVELHAA